jgi:LacI family transcriptional regulator
MNTLKQLAAATGVHITTVAAVINGAGGNTRVGEATRKRVLQAAKRLGYVRNESARRLRTGTSNTVGFIGGDLRNPFFSELASALERELELCQFQLVISHISAVRSANFPQTVEILRQQTIRKIIYWEEAASRSVFPAQPEIQLVPIGFTSRPRPGVWLDLGHAVHLAVNYLIEQGHRRIGFYGPRGVSESPSVLIRKEMFTRECRQRRLPHPACIAYDGESWDIEAAAKGALEFIRKKSTPRAFVGFNDVAALGLLLASEDSLRKPLVVCFDGTPLTRSWPGPPPFLNLKIPELVRQAVALAVGEREDARAGRREEWIRPELVVRIP